LEGIFPHEDKTELFDSSGLEAAGIHGPGCNSNSKQ